MKIAAATEDGVTISQHFGRAPYYMVVTIEDGKIVNQEKRDKVGHHTLGGCDCHEDPSTQGKHGVSAASQDKHAGMSASIRDSQVLITGGMGYGAFESLQNSGIEPIITDVENIDEAVKLYLEGKLVNLMEKLH